LAHPFIATLSTALSNLTTLEIVTTVVPVDVSSDEVTPGGKAMRTRIDLLDGDIRTEIDPVFLTEEYRLIRDLHTAREQSGNTIVQDNIKTLEELLRLARSLPEQA